MVMQKYIVTKDSIIDYENSPCYKHSTAISIVKEKDGSEPGFVWNCRKVTNQDLERIKEYKRL